APDHAGLLLVRAVTSVGSMTETAYRPKAMKEVRKAVISPPRTLRNRSGASCNRVRIIQRHPFAPRQLDPARQIPYGHLPFVSRGCNVMPRERRLRPHSRCVAHGSRCQRSVARHRPVSGDAADGCAIASKMTIRATG